MKKNDTMKRKKQYDIPYTADLKGDEELVVIVVHGFGSSKASPTAEMMMEALPEKGVGVIAFDFPAHGDSPVDGQQLRIGNCMDDLKAVEEYVKEHCPDAEIGYFGSSFGAYITLNYLTKEPHEGAKAFLRSAAVNMPALFRNPAPEQREELDAKGYVTLDYGSGRPLHVTREFIEDLNQHDLFETFAAHGAELKMIHGTSDETIDFARAKAFAEKFGVELIEMAGGDHRLSQPGMPEKVVEEALGFFL